MDQGLSQLDEMQRLYKSAVEQWIIAIRREEDLASTNHSMAQVDRWEEAHFGEEVARGNASKAKKDYEDALRQEFFGF